MKKIILLMLIFIIICFAIPILLTNAFKTGKNIMASTENTILITYEETPKIKEYNYDNYGTVKLLHTKINSVEQIAIDEYLYGVVSAEMPVNFNIEALKAQAIVARTYTIYKIIQNSGKHENADICDNSACCQAWISKQDRLEKWKQNSDESISSNPEANWNKIIAAVEETKGKIITYNGQPINAFFHSNSGGKTEIPLNVWGGTGYPYLQTVATSGENAYSQYNSEVTISKNEFIEKLKSKDAQFNIDFNSNDAIQVLEYTEGGRIKIIKIGNIQLSGVEMRNLFGLRSANFIIEIQNDNVKFTVIGYGHGVGMSQTGADSLANTGNNAEQIIKHFYTGVEIIEI